MALILASGSPRRRELLAQLGLAFTVHAADVDETMNPALPPEDEVVRLSRKKALAVPAGPEDTVVAADTVVVLDGAVLGKPRDAEDAARMLAALSGRTHLVVTGLTVRRGGTLDSVSVPARVTFRPISAAEISEYVATGEPLDKAGAYGIQGRAAAFVERLEGDYYAVVGLPLCPLSKMLAHCGVRK